MPDTLTDSEKAQLEQTIEMFEVITQSQPTDYQSLEILKEAYYKLGRNDDVKRTASNIAQAYVQLGQLSSAILEYESILQVDPDDPDAKKALEDIENQTLNRGGDDEDEVSLPTTQTSTISTPQAQDGSDVPQGLDEGRDAMERIFVEGRIITSPDFNSCWPDPGSYPPGQVVTPFVQTLAERGLMKADETIKILSEKTRLAYFPLAKYDIDLDLAKQFPSNTCKTWCVLPFDRISKAIMVATLNPYNQQAHAELEKVAGTRILYYLAPPEELIKLITGIYR
ncbi:hypothetical protein N9059_01430 [bacterium]|nr:hypothetical protein [bacterium]